MKQKTTFSSILIALILAVFSCKHQPETFDELINGGNSNPQPPDTLLIINEHPCDPDSVYFTNTILPLIVSNCAVEGCHDAITHEDGVRLDNYADIMEEVNPGDLNGSDLWDLINKTDSDVMPPADNGGPLSAQQKLLIQMWILQGALNNSCQEDCDPLGNSFLQHIQPITQLYCEGCHSGNSPSSNLTLSSHAQIQSIALDGRLMNSLHGINGAVLMPQNTTGLPDCYISQFQNWVDAGAPNN